MTCWTFNKCCFCLNLRLGTIIIAFITLVFEVFSVITYSFVAKYITDVYHDQKATSVSGSIYAGQFLIFLFMLMICFKLMLSIALLIGLKKRLPDHLEMWYKGYLVCILLQVAITVCGFISDNKSSAVVKWLILSERIIITILTFYFITVVRSYYFKMCKEVNYYQNMIYTQNSTKGNVLFSEGPTKKDDESQYETIPISSQKAVSKSTGRASPMYGVSVKGGGEIYSAPKNSLVEMPLPMPMVHKDKQSSALYPCLA